MYFSEAIQFLHGLRMFGARLGLDTPRRMAALLGNPHEQLRFIHVAGTNGKGSTCAMLESIYRRAGLRTGLFTSPHLVHFAERIQVDRRLIPENDVARLVAELQPVLAQFSTEAHPTFFEAVTVMALRYFAEEHCDLVIWETGLGGRLDATNIVTPLASVITNIDFDHQEWLGDTLEKIASEKAGIIKPGAPVITAAQPGRGLEVIQETARRLNAPLTIVGQASSLSGTTSVPAQHPGVKEALPAETFGTGRMPVLPLPGEHQRVNAALAIATVRALAKTIPVGDTAIHEGLASVSWPGRIQCVRTPGGQTVVMDGAHNAAGAAALRIAFTNEFPGVRPTLVLGVLADKDWPAIVNPLAPLAARILLVPVNSRRTLPPQELVASCQQANAAMEPEVASSLEDALVRAVDDPFLLITGSLYLVGEAMERLQLSTVPPSDERSLNEWGGTPSANYPLRPGRAAAPSGGVTTNKSQV